MKPLTITRATVASSRCDPVQWSSNSQLSINNNSQITLLDPQLPLIHRSVYAIPQKESQNKALDPRGLFNVSTPVHTDVLQVWPTRQADDFLLDEGKQPFAFGGIGEPMITDHMWSPVTPDTRDCSLGVLLNTGELFILERNTTTYESYKIKHNFFHVLAAFAGLDDEQPADRRRISVLQLEGVLVRSFAFGTSISSEFQHPLVGVILESNALAVFALHGQLPRLAVIWFHDEKISRHLWAQATSSDGGLTIAVAAVLATDNSVHICRLNQEKNGEFTAEEPKCIRASSRFAVSKLQWHNNLLIAVAANELLVFEVDFQTGRVETTSVPINYPYLSSGVLIGSTSLGVKLTVSYETGRFLSYIYSNYTLNQDQTPNQLTEFVARSLYKFQLANSRQSAIESNKNEDGEVTKPFLNNTVEGNFYLHGVSTNANGVVSLVYRIAPKNVLNYTIMSKYDFSIAFFILNDLYPQSEALLPPVGTSLSHINSLWMKKYSDIPVFPKLISEDKAAEVNTFVLEILKFKDDNFADVLTTQLDNLAAANLDFTHFLRAQVSENLGLRSLQVLYNFNLISLKSLELLQTKVPDHTELASLVERIITEQASIKRAISDHVMNCVLTYIQQAGIDLTSELDKYVAITCFHLSLSAQFGSHDYIPKEASIEIATDFVTETFRVTSSTLANDDEADLAFSSSSHKWSRCGLTRLPLLDLQNNADELRLFNYIRWKPEWENTQILNGLLSIKHCIFTGNKIYLRD